MGGENDGSPPHPPVFFVKAESKGLTGALGVKADSKGLQSLGVDDCAGTRPTMGNGST